MAVKPYWLYRFAAWVGIVAGIVFIVLSVFFAGFKIAHLGHHGCHHHGWHHHSMGQGGPHHHGQGAGFHEGVRRSGTVAHAGIRHSFTGSGDPVARISYESGVPSGAPDSLFSGSAAETDHSRTPLT